MEKPHPTAHFAAPSALDLSTLARALGADSLEQRLSALWFGSAQPISDEREVSPLRAAVLWEGLPSFLAEAGWQTAAVVPVEQYSGEVPQFDLRSIPHDLEHSLVAPLGAAVFAHREGDRRLVTFHHRRDEWTIRVCCTSAELAGCWARWDQQAFAASMLRGKVIDPQGRRLLANAPDWSDLFLPEAAVKALQRELSRITRSGSSEGRALGLKPPRGLLLYGSPGSGRTAVAEVLAAQSPFTALWPSAEDLTRGPEKVLDLARSLAPSLLILEDLEGLDREPGFNPWPLADILSETRSRLARLDHQPTVAVIATGSARQPRQRGYGKGPRLFDCSIEIPAADAASARRYVEGRLRRPLSDAEGTQIGSSLAGSPRAVLAAVVDLAIAGALGQDTSPDAEKSAVVSSVLGQIGLDDLLAAAQRFCRSARTQGLKNCTIRPTATLTSTLGSGG